MVDSGRSRQFDANWSEGRNLRYVVCQAGYRRSYTKLGVVVW